MKWLKWSSMCFILMLFGCMAPNHSVQTGAVDKTGTLQLVKSIRDEELYQKGKELFDNGGSIKISEKELANLKPYYIQFRDDNQNAVVSNYSVWIDRKKDRVFFTDYQRPYSYYQVEDEDKEFLAKLLSKTDLAKE
ncbi:hypothetical protein [Rummeliibacillus stabekisii]|uniref:hypothetical protein n=1 Tax=Rummeliibacillus stabekisii TaxID=241244 RepID=UPI003713587B